MNAIMQWDFSVLDQIAAGRTPVLDSFFSVFTHLGDPVVWVVLLIALLAFRKTRRIGICITAAVILDLLLCNLILKPLVCRPRPYALREVALLVKAETDASFPSGHAASSFAMAFCLAFRKNKWALPAFLFAALLAYSRLYLYLHFPTDVLGGIAVGFMCGTLGAYLGSLLLRRFSITRE